MSLVDYNVGPDNVLEECSVLTDHLIVGEKRVEGELAAGVLQLELSYNLPRLAAPVVADGVYLWRPGGEFLLPGRHGGQGHHHQHRTFERVDVEQILEEGDGLDGLAETLQ